MLRKGITVAFLALAVLAPNAWGQEVSPVLNGLNDDIETMGLDVRIHMAELLTDGSEGPDFVRTIVASNRGNKQSGSHFVAGDARRTWGAGTGISLINDLSEGATASGLTAADTAAAIGRAMATWQDQTCSELPIVDFGGFDFDFGFVQFLTGFGGFPGIAADLTHAGFLPPAFFDTIAPPNGSAFILGVTFTFTFVGGDSDGDGKADAAFREIYYNDAFNWAIDGNVDVETVVLHEAGHGLSQAHFGDVFFDSAGHLHFAPRSVMNAVYSGVQQELTGTDNAGHCSIWAHWPN